MESWRVYIPYQEMIVSGPGESVEKGNLTIYTDKKRWGNYHSTTNQRQGDLMFKYVFPETPGPPMSKFSAMSSVFEREKSIMWPDGQTEANPTQGGGGQDFSKHEGQVGVDQKGNRFIIRNGVPVAVGSDDG